ncbi:MAG: TerC/Alx family metal homeostasis membrane protein [Solirubrobacterales bacterium]
MPFLPLAATESLLLPIAGLVVAVAVFSYADLKLFGRGKTEPGLREAIIWSIGWFLLALAVAPLFLLFRDSEQALLYTTVYLIERSLSLDNVFVFLLLFTYFGVSPQERAPLIIWGVMAALLLRGAAIVGGVALLEQFGFLIYLLGIGLLILAVRVFKGVDESVDPENNLLVRGVKRVMPVTTENPEGKWFLRRDGKRYSTPLFLCLTSIVFADIAFAIDSIPAAFAITREALIIWTANIFALLGLRALFVLVEHLIKRFRYLDETIAVVLGLVAVKLIVEEAGLVKAGPVVSLAAVLGLFVVGIVVSLIGERRGWRQSVWPGGDDDDDDEMQSAPEDGSRGDTDTGEAHPAAAEADGDGAAV